MDSHTKDLVDALRELSPLARKKIRATLEDKTMEITYNNWAAALQPDKQHEEPKACGCLMLDGYFKEHPPQFYKHEPMFKDGEFWSVVEQDWTGLLESFYEMEDYDEPDELIGEVATTYDNLIKGTMGATKVVRDTQVLRMPMRKRLIRLIDQAEKLAVVR